MKVGWLVCQRYFDFFCYFPMLMFIITSNCLSPTLPIDTPLIYILTKKKKITIVVLNLLMYCKLVETFQVVSEFNTGLYFERWLIHVFAQ